MQKLSKLLRNNSGLLNRRNTTTPHENERSNLKAHGIEDRSVKAKRSMTYAPNPKPFSTRRVTDAVPAGLLEDCPSPQISFMNVGFVS